MIDSDQQTRPNAGELLDVMLIYRAALERYGRAWDSEPAGVPEGVYLSPDGATFVFAFPITGYRLLPGRRLEKTVLVGSLVARTVYNELGRIAERAFSGRGNPAWN